MKEGAMRAPRATTSRERRLVFACALVGLLAGLGAFLVPRVFAGASASRSYPLDDQKSVSHFAPGIDATHDAAPDFTPARATTVAAPAPLDALRHFLDARVDGDLDRAWDAVSERDRRQYPDASDWQDANGVLPSVTGYTLGPPGVLGARAQVTGTVSYRPGLDDIAGDVPAHANATWALERDGGNWRVSLAESEVLPLYPGDANAAPAARAWVDARLHCRTASQWDGGFVGDADTAVHALCGARGDAQLQPVQELDDTAGAEPFLAAFGADVFTWARVVPVDAPVRLDLVLAPVGDQWLVIGAMEASPRSSG
jgi:hypothetical protein